ncbi:MAG TPA: hypothetical protein VFZ61_26680, partial [Polyangiales bacterium]
QPLPGAAESGSSEHAAEARAEPQPEQPDESAGASERLDRKRLEEQLLALKRKELELRRALAIADHPELAEAIRRLDGRAYALARVDAKIAQGLSKAEDRRKEGLEKKLAGLREKRAELDRQIAELETDHARLVHERDLALEAERRAALQDLVLTLGEHSAALAAAGLDVAELVPEIGQRMPEIRAMAEQLAAQA